MPKIKPMNILIDQDGPLAGFDTRFYAACTEQGWPIDCDEATQTSRWATDHIPDVAQRAQARLMMQEPGWFESLPVTPGAQEGLDKLASVVGIDNIFICTKPLEANPTCRDAKAAWLGENFGQEWVKQLIITPDKSVCRGSILLDDAPHVDWFDRSTWNPVIFPASWNSQGSKWANLPRWSWEQPIRDLLIHAAL